MYTLVGGLIELYRDRGVRRITILGLDGSGKTVSSFLLSSGGDVRDLQ